ncbi:hypothetical protein Q7P37_004087 [Cladosporium fusiforme]
MGNVYNDGEKSDERAVRAILESLSYPGMNDRRDRLAEAHEGTFDWTFLEGKTDFITSRYLSVYDDKETTHTRSVDMNFKAWVEEEKEWLFCVYGKPASGKSTFMYAHSPEISSYVQSQTNMTPRKSLATHKSLERSLKTWAGDDTLIQADHYFWIPGTGMQKTLEGLLRSLLHSVLRALAQPAHVEAIKHICGTRWSSINKHKAWSYLELKEMIHRLSSVPKVKTFFLVDALDECEPQDRLGRLPNDALWISNLPNIKLCVSCRPWKEFTTKFGDTPTLHLDQLTYHDMETYLNDRLVDAEAEFDNGTGFRDFRDGSLPAKRLTQRVTSAAKGVFLWAELVAKEICCEIRKGSSLEELDQVVSSFPLGLDDYFRVLIFDRIGKTRRNVPDTAAALKLAMEITLAMYGPEDYRMVPYSQSFCNFWLLNNGYLKCGFSWTNPIDTAQLCHEAMVTRTATFLHETCKDLLIMSKRSNGDMEVEFLHRTVFDFLREGGLSLFLKQHAPAHFCDRGFLAELTRIRCICLMSGEHATCYRSLLLLSRILEDRVDPQLNVDTSWLRACESLVLTKLQKACNCLGLEHSGPHVFFIRCIDAGRYQLLIDVTATMPHHILSPPMYTLPKFSVQRRLLQAASRMELGASGILLLRHLLECGYYPWTIVERKFGRFHHHKAARTVFGTEYTYWEALLSELYTQTQQANSDSGISEESGAGRCEAVALRKGSACDIIELLLQHGADPCCSPCIADHSKHPRPGCRHMGLEELLDHIVPGERLLPLRHLRTRCSTKPNKSILRRNQRRRAMKSYLISENNFTTKLAEAELPLQDRAFICSKWELQQQIFLMKIMEIQHDYRYLQHICDQCTRNVNGYALVAWCVDCHALSILCMNCSDSYLDEKPTFEHTSSIIPNLPPKGHTSIVVAIQHIDSYVNDLFLALRSRYSVAQAIAVLVAWYNSDPI